MKPTPMTNRRLARVLAVLAGATALALPSPASALVQAGGGGATINCPTTQGAVWMVRSIPVFGPLASSRLGRTYPPLVSNQWDVQVTNEHAATTDSDCAGADQVVAADSGQGSTSGTVTGHDGSSCTFQGPPDTKTSLGGGTCDTGSLRVRFFLHDVTGHLVNCPLLKAPRPPGTTLRPTHGWAWGPQAVGVPCSEANRVIPKVWKVPLVKAKKGVDPSSVEALRTTGGPQPNTQWYCTSWLIQSRTSGFGHRVVTNGSGLCVETAQLPGTGTVRLGPQIYFLGPLAH